MNPRGTNTMNCIALHYISFHLHLNASDILYLISQMTFNSKNVIYLTSSSLNRLPFSTSIILLYFYISCSESQYCNTVYSTFLKHPPQIKLIWQSKVDGWLPVGMGIYQHQEGIKRIAVTK